MPDGNRQGVIFAEAFEKPVWAGFDAEGVTSNGGLLALAALDRRLRICERAAQCLVDARDPSRVEHPPVEMVRQRVYALALGYPDGNDAQALVDDPALRISCQRSLEPEDSLASQPTLSRFENAPKGRELLRMANLLEDVAIEGLRRITPRPPSLQIDLDPSVDPAYGEQQGVLFNGFYDTHCYLPLFGFVSVPGEAEQHLFLARLRPGNAPAARACLPALRRFVSKLRVAFPRVPILVRLDAAFVSPRLLRFLRSYKLRYLLSIQENPALRRLAQRRLDRVRTRCETSHSTEREIFEVSYSALTWAQAERVVVRVEAVFHPTRGVRATARYVVTRVRRQAAGAYALYCGRGEIENRIKELKNDLEIDRTSCSRFCANQMRVLLTALSYSLLQQMRGDLRSTPLARAQVGKLRALLLKIGASITESVRRLAFHLAAATPFASLWNRLAFRYGALTG